MIARAARRDERPCFRPNAAINAMAEVKIGFEASTHLLRELSGELPGDLPPDLTRQTYARVREAGEAY